VTAIDLDAMRVIAAVARAGSIAGAATVVGTTPQAVSARLRGAERALGLHLFDRTTAGTVATATGHDIAAWAAEVLEAADRFEERTEQLRAPRPGTVRVAASLTIAEHLAPAWMVETAETTADRVELAAMNSVEVCAAVRARDVDLGFVESTDVPGDLASTLVARDELVLVAAPGSTVGTAGGLTLAELAATPLVTREEGSGTRSSFEHLCHSHGLDVVASPVRVVATTAGVRAAVAAGVGPAVLSTLAVRDDLALGRLRRIRVTDARLVRPLTAVWRRDRELGAAAARFVETARRTARDA